MEPAFFRNCRLECFLQYHRNRQHFACRKNNHTTEYNVKVGTEYSTNRKAGARISGRYNRAYEVFIRFCSVVPSLQKTFLNVKGGRCIAEISAIYFVYRLEL